ncbi:hypothetical protein PN36_07135 [Candidatus Thiomargarita nelsonii]|uniref:Uncharacterized protein n=1 Tax=Candidatus Thiomargarita nelsonii TaxID=1003181 RepID=A0A0A6PLK0_9GAMM|nr:hypothetical protein PN36_07135 [Candidatus Thiomargarita nelsonii]
MTSDSSHHQGLQAAVDAFIQTPSMEEALKVLQTYPDLLTDQADILLASIITSARQEGHEITAQALDERRDFIRSVREEIDPK